MSMEAEKEEFGRSGEGVYNYVNSLYERIIAAVRFSCEKIIQIINTSDDTIFPLPSSANPHTLGETLFPLIYDIWKHTLNNYHAITLKSQEFRGSHSDPTFKSLEFLKLSVARFLSKLYLELYRFDNEMPSAQSLLLRTINKSFMELESDLGSLSFARLPFEHIDCLDDDQLTDVVHVIVSNQNKLDKFISLLLTNDNEAKIKSRRRMHYTFGAIGISVVSIWLLRDSRLSGNINNWVLETKESTVWFLRDNVMQAFKVIRDALLEGYRGSNIDKEIMESKRRQEIVSDTLRVMLLDFGKRTGLKFPPNASDQEMYNIVENYIEEHVFGHPIRSFFRGVSARSMLIQLLKVNLEAEETIPPLICLEKLTTDIKFLVLGVIPTIFVSVGVYKLLVKVGTWMRNKRERIATAQRTELLLNVKKHVEMQNKIMSLSSELRDEDPDYVNGLLLYSVDRLYRAVKKCSKEREADWSGYIEFLAKPDAETSRKIEFIYHLKKAWRC